MHHDPASNGLDVAGRDTRTRARPRREGLSSAWWLAVVPAAILLIAVLVIVNRGGSGPPTTTRVVVASLPYWSIGPVTDSVLANRNDINGASPWMYGLGGKRQIILDSGIDAASLQAGLCPPRPRALPVL